MRRPGRFPYSTRSQRDARLIDGDRKLPTPAINFTATLARVFLRLPGSAAHTLPSLSSSAGTPGAGWVTLVVALLIALLVVGVLLARQYNVTRRLSGRLVAYRDGLRVLADVHLPAALDPTAPGPGVGAHRVPELDGYGERVIALARVAAGAAARRGAEDAQSALMGVTRTLRALVTEQQSAIEQMQRAFDDPDVLAGLMDIDLTAGQLARRVVGVGVLCGSSTGIQREDTSVEQVVRGAMGRIRDHHRVELGAPVPWAVRGPGVEAIVLVVAELLDNAARGSSPSTKVRVSLFPVDRGVVVQIDDAGVGMAPEQVERAERLLSGQLVVDVRDLGNPAQVGFPVCGVLAAQHGLTITVGRQSPYGGTQAIVLLPTDLLVPVHEPAPEPVPAALPAPVRRVPAQVPPAGDTGATTPGGLPVRRREKSAPTPEPAPAAHWTTPPDLRPAVLGAWQRGTATGRELTTSEHPQERTS